MTKRLHAAVCLALMAGGLLLSGCAGGSYQYSSPAVQEQSQPYRGLYGPFGLEPGPSATNSGDE